MSRKARDMGTRVWWNSTHPNILLLRGADLGHPPGALQVPQFVPSSSPACCIPSIPFHLLHASSSRSSFSRRWPGLDPEVTYDLALNFFAGSARTHGKTVLNQPIVSERKQIPVLHNLASRSMDGASEQCKEIVTSNARATLLAASPESNQ